MRKIIATAIFLLVSLFGLFGVQLGFASQIDPANIIGSLLIVGVWIFTEFKRDWAEFNEKVQQFNKWSDPAFWTAAIGSLVLPILNLFNVQLSPEIISLIAAVLAAVVPFLVKAFRKTEPSA